MKKLGPNGVKLLKIVHVFLVVLMLGGIITSTTLRIRMQLTNYADVLAAYRLLQDASDQVIRYGGFGLLLSGILYGMATNWGFFRYRWVTVKWIIFMAQTIFGMFFIDRWMVDNLSILEAKQSLALVDPTFLHQHWLLQVGATAQIIGLIFLIGVSVFKPWKKKAEAKAR